MIMNSGWRGTMNAGVWLDDAGQEREATAGQKDSAVKEIEGLKVAAVAIEQKDKKRSHESVGLLEELGFTLLSGEASRVAKRAMKENMIGMAGYKKIPYSKFKEAYARIQKNSGGTLRLSITAVDSYKGQDGEKLTLPPMDVLGKMKTAKKEGLFDNFAIIHVEKVRDPILVGLVDDVQDLYMIAEWGDDISFDEIMK